MTDTIVIFNGQYRFLSNFWPSLVEMEGHDYLTVEHAYQAAKTIDPDLRVIVQNMATPGKAKRYGGNLTLRPDWVNIRLPLMRNLVYKKFHRHERLAEQLLETDDALLVEGNTWGDTFWGVCRGRGENNLGKILMAIRAGLREKVS